jgi:N-acetylmuramate 1-kinase
VSLPGETIRFCLESLGIPSPASLQIFPLARRGSDRVFFRLKWPPEKSAVLIQYDPRRRENAYYAEIAGFLAEIAVPVPRIIRHDPEARLLILEDLGEEDLWSFRSAPRERRKALYEKTLRAVYRLHSFPEKEFPGDRVRLIEPFGPELYRWERAYFREHFTDGFCGIKPEPSFERKLEGELAALAERLSAGRPCLVHRDLQSQNVMIRGGEPVFIDFQGLRFGNAFYDLGSLLCDPYAALAEREREELLSFYFRLGPGARSWSDFRIRFWEASAQRLMQALGAFGFLGSRKGLEIFWEHIPAGLRALEQAAQAASLPLLAKAADACREAANRK